jgi:hypothetical protein
LTRFGHTKTNTSKRTGKGIVVNSVNANYFIHGANILLVVAYSVRDILWLRLFALAASLITIPYFLLQPKPLWVS